jgi:hypothetical protein
VLQSPAGLAGENSGRWASASPEARPRLSLELIEPLSDPTSRVIQRLVEMHQLASLRVVDVEQVVAGARDTRQERSRGPWSFLETEGQPGARGYDGANRCGISLKI